MKRVFFGICLVFFVTGSLLAQAAKPAPPAKPAAPAKASPAATQDQSDVVAVLQTKLGKIVIQFFPDKAPNHVKNFTALCKSGFYNGTKFHRTIPGFMIQGGDPNTKAGDPSTWGQGGHMDASGKEVTVKAEFNDIHHARGIVSMARSQDPNSASSQFFICVADAGFLDRQYTAFGEVISGMDVVDKIVNAPAKPGVGPDTVPSLPVSPVAIDKATIEKKSAQAASAPAEPAKPKAETPAQAGKPSK
jgi:peptidyl-prolyl cis-trans isomerase B (cyclophilin B)